MIKSMPLILNTLNIFNTKHLPAVLWQVDTVRYQSFFDSENLWPADRQKISFVFSLRLQALTPASGRWWVTSRPPPGASVGNPSWTTTRSTCSPPSSSPSCCRGWRGGCGRDRPPAGKRRGAKRRAEADCWFLKDVWVICRPSLVTEAPH